MDAVLVAGVVSNSILPEADNIRRLAKSGRSPPNLRSTRVHMLPTD